MCCKNDAKLLARYRRRANPFTVYKLRELIDGQLHSPNWAHRPGGITNGAGWIPSSRRTTRINSDGDLVGPGLHAFTDKAGANAYRNQVLREEDWYTPARLAVVAVKVDPQDVMAAGLMAYGDGHPVMNGRRRTYPQVVIMRAEISQAEFDRATKKAKKAK